MLATYLADFVAPKELIAALLVLHKGGIEVVRGGEPVSDLTTETDYVAGDALVCNDNEVFFTREEA